LVQGMGTDEDFDRRVGLERLLGGALEGAGLGSCDGGDGGSGTMNVFLVISDPPAARQVILQTLREEGELDDLVIVHTGRREEAGEDDDGVETVWWPEDYAYRFTIFGPAWKGPLPAAELARLDPDTRALQGVWKVVRYDAPDGTKTSEWSAGLRFLFVR